MGLTEKFLAALLVLVLVLHQAAPSEGTRQDVRRRDRDRELPAITEPESQGMRADTEPDSEMTGLLGSVAGGLLGTAVGNDGDHTGVAAPVVGSVIGGVMGKTLAPSILVPLYPEGAATTLGQLLGTMVTPARVGRQGQGATDHKNPGPQIWPGIKKLMKHHHQAGLHHPLHPKKVHNIYFISGLGHNYLPLGPYGGYAPWVHHPSLKPIHDVHDVHDVHQEIAPK